MNVDVSPNNISCFLICLLAAKFDFIMQCVILDIKLTLDGFSVIFRQKEFSLKKRNLFKTDVFTEIYFKCDYQ